MIELDSPFDFYCETYKCKMRKSACEKRRNISSQGIRDINKEMRISGCGKCKQDEDMEEQTKFNAQKPSEMKKICKKCGCLKPLDAFYTCKSRDGYGGQCKKCKNDARKANETLQHKEKPMENTIDPGIRIPAVAKEISKNFSKVIQESKIAIEEKLKPQPGKTLTLDFEKYPALFEMIHKIADDELRAPEMQVLFWIRSHLSNNSISGGVENKFSDIVTR